MRDGLEAPYGPCLVAFGMRAIDSDEQPSSLRAYVGMLWHRRPGLMDPAAMPRLTRSMQGIRLRADWLQAYRRCIGLQAGPADELPPLALQIAAAPLHLSLLADPRFPFKALGLVHLSQRITQHKAISPTQAVELRAFTTQAQWARRGMSFDLVTEAWSEGQLLWRAETTALASGPSPLAPSEASGSVAGGKGVQGKNDAQSEDPPWRDVASIQVPEALGRRYAAIAGDLNPIHQHALLARPFGFRRAIIHGTWTLARALAAAGLPAASVYSVEARFRKPVFLPSGIRVRVQDGADQAELQVVSADLGVVHLAGRVTL